jgi:hypothetical protein
MFDLLVRWMRNLVLLLCLGALCASAAAATASTDERSGAIRAALPSRPTLTALYVCAYERYSLAFHGCLADQRRTPLLSTRFVCDISYATPRPAILHLRWTYDGHPLPEFTRSVMRGSRAASLKLDSGGPTMPLPGGNYSCAFDLGRSHKAASFVSRGPTGPVVDIEVCETNNAFTYGTFPVCRSDESGAPIATSSDLVCDGILPDDTGRTVYVVAAAADDGTIVAQSGRAVESGPLEQRSLRIPRSALHAGDYSCQFLLDGTVAAEQHFQIAP